ncbi:MAG: carbonic anhydrase [Planctomycetaceae bacterium]|jgi:carbonic anhydrase|nr:carbonic anhydrase [Planctomycetaceae bacterium]
MKKRISTAFVLLMTFYPVCASDPHSVPGVPPEKALEMLKEGNARFVGEKAEHPHTKIDRVRDTAVNGQHPFVTMMACSDSRVPLEEIFDQGVGDIFSIRVAGNVSGSDEIGSIEYGVVHTGTRLLVVLGHTKCGAVTAACTGGGHEGNIENLMRALQPAVAVTESKTGKRGTEIIPQCCRENVFVQIENILKNSKILQESVKKGELTVVGAIYDIDTGCVEFLGQHPFTATLANGANGIPATRPVSMPRSVQSSYPAPAYRPVPATYSAGSYPVLVTEESSLPGQPQKPRRQGGVRNLLKRQ